MIKLCASTLSLDLQPRGMRLRWEERDGKLNVFVRYVNVNRDRAYKADKGGPMVRSKLMDEADRGNQVNC